MHEYHILKYGGITAHLGSDKLQFGFYTLALAFTRCSSKRQTLLL